MAYYLIDYENVKSIGPLEALGDSDSVFFFYTKNADSLSFDLHRAILAARARIYYISVASGGKNALDFQLSTHIGYLVANNPDERFYIVSNDTGFDYVIAFCKEKYGITVELIPAIGAKRKTRVRTVKAKPEPKKRAEVKKPKSEPKKTEEAAAVQPAPKKRTAKKPQEPEPSPQEAVRAALEAASVKWKDKDKDILKILEILSTAKTKVDVNTALSQYFKDNATVSKLMRLVRPMLKELP